MSDEEDDEITDPKHKFTAKCEKTNACAKLLVSWPRHAHAPEERGRLARGRVLNALLLPCPQVVYEECAERIEAKGQGQCTGQFSKR